jgi:hypothetical protein
MAWLALAAYCIAQYCLAVVWLALAGWCVTQYCYAVIWLVLAIHMHLSGVQSPELCLSAGLACVLPPFVVPLRCLHLTQV